MVDMPIKVMLVEDDEPMVKEFKDLFEKLPNFILAGVASGQTEALEMMKKDPPSVAIVDISLREGDGTGLIEEIASDKHLPFRPCIVVITAIQSDVVHEKLYEMGVNYRFDKDEPNFGAGLIAEFLIQIEDSLPDRHHLHSFSFFE